MKILSLDLATKTGWAVAEGGKILSSGAENFAVRRGESAGMLFVRFRAFLSGMVSMIQPNLVGYEDPLFMGRSTAATRRVLIGMAAHTESVCTERDVNFTPVHGATLKKYASDCTGLKGRSKKLMVDAAAIAWPEHKFIDDNESDAVWLCDYLFYLYDYDPGKNVGRLAFLE